MRVLSYSVTVRSCPCPSAASLPARHCNVSLTVSGEIPEYQRIPDLARTLDVSDRLEIFALFRGSDEIDRIVEARCIFLLSALFEASRWPLYMSQRARVTIATDVGGIREMLGAGAGCVVRVADSSAMAAAAQMPIENPDRLLAMNQRAIPVFRDRYHKNVVLPRIVKLYGEVLQRTCL